MPVDYPARSKYLREARAHSNRNVAPVLYNAPPPEPVSAPVSAPTKPKPARRYSDSVVPVRGGAVRTWTGR